MSRNYDNWERLVAAVIKREQVWELCHARSSTTSFSSSVSSDFNSQFQEDFKSARSAVQEVSTDPQIDFEWHEQYEPGVYLRLGYSTDETTEIRQARFSRRRFNEGVAETWWLNNREEVYLRFVGKPRRDWAPFIDKSDNVELIMLETPVSLGTRSTFGTSRKPKDSLVDTRANNIQKLIEWFQYYEPDVCVILRAYREDRDGTTYVARVSFSGRSFEARQAEAWWIVNRQKVCEKYGARAGLAQIKPSSLSGQAPR